MCIRDRYSDHPEVQRFQSLAVDILMAPSLQVFVGQIFSDFTVSKHNRNIMSLEWLKLNQSFVPYRHLCEILRDWTATAVFITSPPARSTWHWWHFQGHWFKGQGHRNVFRCRPTSRWIIMEDHRVCIILCRRTVFTITVSTKLVQLPLPLCGVIGNKRF